MLDIKEIRQDRERVEELIRRKDLDGDLSEVIRLDTEIRERKTRVEQLKSQRNTASKQIGELKRKGEDTSSIMAEMSGISDEIRSIDSELQTLEADFETTLSSFPNLPDEDVAISQDPADNVVLKEWGEKPSFAFDSKNHLELNEKLGVFDFVRGAKVSGSGWPVYHDMGARLEWALLNYMLETQLKHGYKMWWPPFLARPEILFGAGQLPKFKDQQFRITDEDYDLFLIPTAEVALNGLHQEEILTAEELPHRYVAYTPCFRREAGAAGSQERGLIRVHQFNKVELFCLTKPEDSEAIHKEMIAHAEAVLEGLEMHYRSMLLVTGDMSFSSSRTIDIEVWLPGQNRYYEVSSVSNCRDFQARRAQIRFRREAGAKPEFVHTLNGSGLATARLMVGILENNQQEDGSVIIPEVLRKYLGGIERLEPQG